MTSLVEVLSERSGQMATRHLNSRKEARQTLLTWSCMERVWSILTPRYFTEVLKGILLLPMFVRLQSTRLKQDEVPTAITSVLLVFYPHQPKVHHTHQLVPNARHPRQSVLEVHHLPKLVPEVRHPHQSVLNVRHPHQLMPKVRHPHRSVLNVRHPHQLVPRVHQPHRSVLNARHPHQLVPKVRHPHRSVHKVCHPHQLVPKVRPSPLINRCSRSDILPAGAGSPRLLSTGGRSPPPLLISERSWPFALIRH